MEYGSGSGGVWNMALRVEVCKISLWEWRCVEYGSGSGDVWYIALGVEMCVIRL